MKSYVWRTYAYTCTIIFLSATILLSAIPAAGAQTDEQSGSYTLTISESGKVTLEASGIALRTILEQLKTKMKLTFSIPEKHLDTPISTSFKSLSLHQAINRILHGISHACILNADGQVKKVITVSDGKSPKQQSSPPLETPAPHTTQSDLPLPHEPPMEVSKTTAAQMPPSEVMEILKHELAPVPPPDAILKDE